MNSSPPPPSFTLPPLNSAGQFPITPDDSPTSDRGAEASKDYLSAGQAAKGAFQQHEVRLSMYARLFDEMINTVLQSESYLFTPRELWVLKYILALPYEPLYLLTRLLLRRPGRILPFTSLSPSYSPELGDDGVKRAMACLSRPLAIPADILAEEPPVASSSKRGGLSAPKPRLPSSLNVNGPRTPMSAKAKGKSRQSSKPWDHLETGLSAEEEKADPQLAAAIRESLWAAQVGRVEIDDGGVVVPSPPPSRPSGSRSVSGSSTESRESETPSTATPQHAQPHADFTEEFSLTPKPPPPITVLARDETTLSLDEIMSCISAEDLRKVARARKVPLSALSNREAVQTALRGLAKKQTVLGFAPVKGKGKESAVNGRAVSAGQTTLPFGTTSPASPGRVTSEGLLISSLLPLIGQHAIQLTPELHSLIARVNLIFSRTPPLTSTSSSLMLPSILVTSNKRRYPDYGPPTRSIIWKDRDELMVWERAVHWEAVVADALGDTWAEQRKNNVIPGFGVRREMPSRVEGAKVVKRVWEGVWAVWKELVQGDGGNAVDAADQQGGLVGDRFKTGHVLTRIVYKAATALGILHEYDLECMVLRALLQQRRWRRGKRGAWYERLALVLMNHYNAKDQEKLEKRREATQVCIDGLLDEDTHLIYRPGLSRRLTRLENKLDLPADERHISYAELLKCETRELVAPRVKENMGQPKMRPGRADSVRDREASLGLEEDVALRGGIQQVGKSVWVGRDGEVTVEGWVLEWWEKRGYKGYHSEGSILTTLFGLLLWPVLFHPLPGAFETPYQTAPLDLGEDTFAPSRQDLLESRLEQMSKTRNALDMLKDADERERSKQTWAVGVSWEYGRDELAEVLECLGGRAMAGICRMLAEEYRHRVSGVPDLIVWNYETKEARFIEVKGPGDNLSETQKIWIDVLLSAGVPVEVCRVKAKDPSASDEKRLDRKRKMGSVKPENGVPKKTKVEAAKEEYEEAMAEIGAAGDEDEWAYESGEEGKAEGRWATGQSLGDQHAHQRRRVSS